MISWLIRILCNTTLFDESLWDEADRNYEHYRATHPTKLRAALPENFTWNTSDCIQLNMKDQGSCGSCWAAATAATLGMRRCIKLGDRTVISIQEFVGCDHTSMYGVTNNGCYGGHPLPAMQYGYNTGATYEKCYKYTAGKSYYPYPTYPCQPACDNSTAKPRAKNGPARRLIGEDAIMQEIYNSGPVTGSFMLYSDFDAKTRNDGIFTVNTSAAQWGGHAVILIGWGVRNGVKYWQAQNTYGPTWQNGGYFKIRRGTNEATIESAAAASDPIGGEMVLTGSLVFDSTWLTKNNVTIKYENVQSCALKIGSTTIATINGTGSTTYYLGVAAGTYAVTCGNLARTITIIEYAPRFNATQFTGTPSKGARLAFTTASGITQRLSYGTWNTTTLAGYVDVFPAVGVYSATLQTVQTNPILTATATMTIQQDDLRLLQIIQHPKAALTGEQISASVKVQYISQLTIKVLNANGTVLQEQQWTTTQNYQNEQTVYASYIPKATGQVLFQFANNDLVVKTNPATISESFAQITSPQNGQIVVKGYTVTIKTTGLNGEQVLLNGKALGVVANNTLAWKVTESPGDYQLVIGTLYCSVVVVPPPVLSEKQYNFSVGDQHIIAIASADNFLHDTHAVATFQGSELKISNNTVTVSSSTNQTVLLTVALPDSLPQYEVSATVVFGTACSIALEPRPRYIFGFKYAIQTTCAGPYAIYSPSGNLQTSVPIFQPVETGNHRICAGQTCMEVVFVHGLEITSTLTSPATLSDLITLSWNVTPQYTGRLALEYFCKGQTGATDLLLIDAQALKLQFKVPQSAACNEAAFRLRAEQKPYFYGDVFFALQRTELQPGIATTPFERDPAMDLEVGKPSQPSVPAPGEEVPPTDNGTVPTPPPTEFLGYYPNETAFVSGQTLTLLWVTNLSKTNLVTINLYGGRPSTQKFIKTITSTATNNGSYQVTLPALDVGQYYFLLRTVEGGVTKYTTNLYFSIKSALVLSAHADNSRLTVSLNSAAELFLVDEDDVLIQSIGTAERAELPLPGHEHFKVRACHDGNCVESQLFNK